MSKFFKLYTALIFINSLAQANINISHNIITFFIKDYEQKFKPVDKLFKNIHKKIINRKSFHHPQHVFVAYAGYYTLSDENNQVRLPNRSTKKSFTLVVTDKIEPILMFPNTIAYWQVPHDTKLKMFKIKIIKDNTQQYWKVTSINRPKSGKIAAEAIIIFAKPKNIIVPIGEFPTHQSEQIFLPDIFIKKDFNEAKNALFIINISKFFRPDASIVNSKNNNISGINK